MSIADHLPSVPLEASRYLQDSAQRKIPVPGCKHILFSTTPQKRREDDNIIGKGPLSASILILVIISLQASSFAPERPKEQKTGVVSRKYELPIRGMIGAIEIEARSTKKPIVQAIIILDINIYHYCLGSHPKFPTPLFPSRSRLEQPETTYLASFDTASRLGLAHHHDLLVLDFLGILCISAGSATEQSPFLPIH